MCIGFEDVGISAIVKKNSSMSSTIQVYTSIDKDT